jgi:hypothetical protein
MRIQSHRLVHFDKLRSCLIPLVQITLFVMNIMMA